MTIGEVLTELAEAFYRPFSCVTQVTGVIIGHFHRKEKVPNEGVIPDLSCEGCQEDTQVLFHVLCIPR